MVLRPYCRQPAPRMPEFAQDVGPVRAFSIINHTKKWVNGTELTYYCYSSADAVPAAWRGKASDVQEVHAAFTKWSNLGLGLSFKAVSRAEDAQVRIGFDANDGSWSFMGRDVLLERDPLHRTMNFGWALSTVYGRDTALHEIGHTLGLEHEHQNPNGGIVWDEPAVFQYFRGSPNFWNDRQIRQNILDKLNPSQIKSTTWDPNSVMQYEFDAGLIMEPAQYRSGIKPAGGLSADDISWAKATYPGVAVNQVTSLKVAQSSLLNLGRGQTRLFNFKPSRTRTYQIGTFGTSDTVMVLFEKTAQGNVQIAGDDDSGQDRNALIKMRLTKGREYQIGVRLYYADAEAETSIMVW
jgi:hypothetical protein